MRSQNKSLCRAAFTFKIKDKSSNPSTSGEHVLLTVGWAWPWWPSDCFDISPINLFGRVLCDCLSSLWWSDSCCYKDSREQSHVDVSDCKNPEWSHAPGQTPVDLTQVCEEPVETSLVLLLPWPSAWPFLRKHTQMAASSSFLRHSSLVMSHCRCSGSFYWKAAQKHSSVFNENTNNHRLFSLHNRNLVNRPSVGV